jgi:methylenetetrahydrofolate reductase (NADPH)
VVDIYKPDRKMTEILAEKRFTVSAEVIPPRNGTPHQEIITQIDELIKSGSEFLSVTKGAGGSLRGGSLPIAQVIKDHFKVPAIAHFTCRDLTPAEVENQLMDHHYFGIRNILALRGDPPQGLPDWVPNAGSYPYAYQLIEQIKKLNRGEFLQRQGFSTETQLRTDFCIGAAAYPDEPNSDSRLEHFRLKVMAGAEYGITQMIYDVDSYAKFLEDLAVRKSSVPILPGLRILKTKSQALKMRDRFQISMPRKLVDSLPETENPSQSLEIFLKLIKDFRRAGAPGLHVFVLSDLQQSSGLIQRLRVT